MIGYMFKNDIESRLHKVCLCKLKRPRDPALTISDWMLANHQLYHQTQPAQWQILNPSILHLLILSHSI